ncbi:hypothetical protein JHL17_34160 [Azospirillum sp. YIM B02556]|uniref:Uncharacterized protein n=1 Tax=Azospirillum endophyticum TaxID=2800326 RepID=A0ABS1FG92_9PROT|nr:hypothetical protein [Azospirillum endophyticum]MBK1842452.1 hypothetical protein [Azospirillum endophyticum]
MTASAAWRRWSAVRIELAELLAEQERQHRKQAVPAVLVGRQRYADPAQLEATPAPGWTAISDEAAQRFRRMIAAKVARLKAGKPGHEVSGTAAWRVRRLEQEARRLAAEMRARPVIGAADVLARLDVIAAMWGPDGTITEPGAPLAEVLELLDELSRSVPGFTATWRRCRQIEHKTGCASRQLRCAVRRSS